MPTTPATTSTFKRPLVWTIGSSLLTRTGNDGSRLLGTKAEIQQALIDYLIEENRVLKAQLEGQRLRFTDAQRRRLAVKAKVLGRQLLDELETLVTPDTLLAQCVRGAIYTRR